jgi:hypothetical protein
VPQQHLAQHEMLLQMLKHGQMLLQQSPVALQLLDLNNQEGLVDTLQLQVHYKKLLQLQIDY